MKFLDLFQPVEVLFQYWKSQDQVELKSIFDSLMDNLYDNPISELNLKSISDNFVQSKAETFDNVTEINEDELENLAEGEKGSLNALFAVFHFMAYHYDKLNWASKNIGTFLVKTVMQYPNFIRTGYIADDRIPFNEIDDAFTPLGNGNVSWPDIAMAYNLKDFRVLLEYGSELNSPAKYIEAEPCDDYWDLFSDCSPPGDPERYSSFQICFNEVLNQTNYQDEEEFKFKKEDRVKKSIQLSPCYQIEKFPSCAEYCDWHKNFFETIGKEEFLLAMSYASPQRKTYRDTTSMEKNMAGIMIP